jgi:TolA-binding protein
MIQFTLVRRAILGPAMLLPLLGVSGCLASKGDIRLLQDELRATRAQLATGDTAQLRQQEFRRSEIAALSAKIDRLNDSVRTLTARVATLQATANGNFDAINQQLVQLQTLAGQTTRNLQEQRARLEALSEQAAASAAPPPLSPTSGTPPGRDSAAMRGPGPATLFSSANEQLKTGAYGSARRGFEQLVNSYPDDELAPQAFVKIGEAYRAEGNIAASDSVNQLVYTRFPKSPYAATGMYRHAKLLWDNNKKQEARPLLNRVIREFPRSDEAVLANDLLKGRS